MQARTILSWQTKEADFVPKERSWYWAVGIVAGGIAIAAVLLSNYLFAVIAVLGGFTVMVVGSAKPRRHTYRLTETGFMIGTKLIPYKDIQRFAIHEEEPTTLVLETRTLSGTIHAPLGHTDYRSIEMELKNRDIEEVESLHTFADHLASGMGL